MSPRKNPIIIFIFIAIMGLVLFFVLTVHESVSPSQSSDSPKLAVPVTPPDSWIIMDTTLVNGPESVGFSIHEFLEAQQGYLSDYSENVYGVPMVASAIIQKVAEDYSINPKVLIGLIETQSGWISMDQNGSVPAGYPLAPSQLLGDGLFVQLSRAAELLNFGFYARRVGAFDQVELLDGSVVFLPEDANAGTAALYSFYASLVEQYDWTVIIGGGQFLKVYQRLFGDPFLLWDGNLHFDIPVQPLMQLPFVDGKTWAFTGGPHSAWGRNSAWAAIDFAPPKDRLGCVQNDEWVVAVADGKIVRSDHAVVILDLDGDGYEQTGWVVMYLHIETRNRIDEGVVVQAGQKIGHASCEGGISTGTHVHIARKFNGEWIPADQKNPFILDGWVSGGTGIEYNGTLKKQDLVIEALDGRQEQNSITR